MSSVAAAGWLLLVIAVLLANGPFLTERRLGLIAPRPSGDGAVATKGLGFRFLELMLGYALTLGCGFLIETSLGQRAPQRWEFYGITACLFLVLAFPGFTWRYLRRGGRPH